MASKNGWFGQWFASPAPPEVEPKPEIQGEFKDAHGVSTVSKIQIEDLQERRDEPKPEPENPVQAVNEKTYQKELQAKIDSMEARLSTNENQARTTFIESNEPPEPNTASRWQIETLKEEIEIPGFQETPVQSFVRENQNAEREERIETMETQLGQVDGHARFHFDLESIRADIEMGNIDTGEGFER